jgi:intracellular sulfur oxidation DsrE/DsrF family protein
MLTARRQSLKGLGVALAAAGLASAAPTGPAQASAAAPLVPPGATTLDALTAQLAKAPRRRDFKTVPMILNARDQWDAEALDAVLHYAGGPKQSWDNTDIGGPWLNVMRNAMNAQIWSFGHADFLCVSATHGTAQLALYDAAMWSKYDLAKLAGKGFPQNSLVAAPAAAAADPKDYENPHGAFSPAANSIEALQRRGAVFLACHNAVWELAGRLVATGVNHDHLGVEALCAELTNHLIAGVVLTPGAVGTLVELASAGFAYAR